MDIITIDFETYYDDEYTLRKMTNVEYVRDPRFLCLGCAVAINREPAVWYDKETIRNASIDWANSKVVSHNAPFDALILLEHFGIDPAMWGDTLGMARALIPMKRYSLLHVAKALGMKASKPELTKGLREADDALIERCLYDTNTCRDIYYVLAPLLPETEHRLVHTTTKWAVSAVLELDVPLLEEALAEETQSRAELIHRSGVDEEVLASNPKFAALLQERGVPIPKKISAATGEETEAFAKNDPEFQELMELVPGMAHIWEARLAVKSAGDIPRIQRFLNIGRSGKMIMPLNYWGARTTGRWSGSQGINVQNLKRDSKLRKSIRAPKGYVVMAGDSAQIELRVNFWFSQQRDYLDILKNGGPIYETTGAKIVGKTVEEIIEEHKHGTSLGRMLGKATELGAGYGMGWRKFKQTCAGGPFGMPPIHLTDSEAWNAIAGYRATHPYVEQNWRVLQDLIPLMMSKDTRQNYQCVTFRHCAIELPNGTHLFYPQLHEVEGGNFVYHIQDVLSGSSWDTFLYGAKLMENICQALARAIIGEQILEVEKIYPTVSSTHDEIILLVPENEADDAAKEIKRIMSVSPTWASDLPLSASVGYAENYSK